MRQTLAALFATLTLGLSAACTPAANPGELTVTTAGGPSGGPSTDWKEGYGGDTLEIEVLREIDGICSRARDLRPTILNRSLEAKNTLGEPVDVVSGICGLMRQGELRIEIVDQPVLSGESKDMANFPHDKPRRLQIKRSWWQDKTIQQDVRQALILHELMPLIGLSDVDYVRSTRLLIALVARESRVTVVSCDEKRLEAVFAGAPQDLLRIYSHFHGTRLCKPALEVLSRYSATEDFGEELTLAMQHHFIWGAFQKMAREFSQDEISQAAHFLSDTMDQLPNTVRPLSHQTCNEIGEIRPGQIGCGNFLELVAGASPAFKARTVGKFTLSGVDYFDRAAFMLVKLMESRRERNQNVAGNLLFNNGGAISRELIARAIEGQNWWIVALFGQIHKKFDPRKSPPHSLLRDINFDEIRKNSVLPDREDGIFDGRIQDIRPCSGAQLRGHASGVINGDRMDPLYCGESAVI